MARDPTEDALYPLEWTMASRPSGDSGRRFLFLGTCAIDAIVAGARENGAVADHFLWESHAHAPRPAVDPARYDAVVVSLTLRHLFMEATRTLEPEAPPDHCIYWVRTLANGRAEEYLQACNAAASKRLGFISEFTGARPTFLLSFIEPRHNYVGNLFPRYDLSNPRYFVAQLNEFIGRTIEAFAHLRFIDINEIIALFGNLRVQDDFVSQLSHAAYLSDDSWDKGRMQSSTPPPRMYDAEEPIRRVGRALARRLEDNVSILERPMLVKAIIVDLDDTLWRGVAADEDRPLYEFVDDWPLGVAEALLIFKARGGLLAICSRNDREPAQRAFDRIYRGRLSFSDFASLRINHRPKSENISEILAELNIEPESALFIDDNPREIDEVRTALPRMRFLSQEHYDWRRQILMSPLTQTAHLTGDSRARTEMVQAKIRRDHERGAASDRQVWLESLTLVQTFAWVSSTQDVHFARAIELINKTNQFNTTGRRWAASEAEEFFREGGRFLCSFLQDRITDNGMVGVSVVRDAEIVQCVLSCRAFSLGSEYATGHYLCSHLLDHWPEVFATLVENGRNLSCHSYFANLGFRERDGRLVASTAPPPVSHIRTAVDESPVTDE
jgi:FkbH-like protein